MLLERTLDECSVASDVSIKSAMCVLKTVVEKFGMLQEKHVQQTFEVWPMHTASGIFIHFVWCLVHISRKQLFSGLTCSASCIPRLGIVNMPWVGVTVSRK